MAIVNQFCQGVETMKSHAVRAVFFVFATIPLFHVVTFAQDSKPGKLKVEVTPREAYTFVDGDAIGPGNRTIKLVAGAHHVVVGNYGFKFAEEDVSIDSGQTVPLKIELQPVGDPLNGPRGRIQIEDGARRWGNAAVLLNGKTPRYFVGHVDEFNHNILLHQELIVPPGTHQVTVTRYGKELWSGLITVSSDQRVIVKIPNGKQSMKEWTRGSKELAAAIPRFKAGAASATIVVAPVSGTLAANPSRIDCGRSSQLTWASNETVDADMSGMSPVPTSGERAVSPRQTTTYQLTASGPGGTVKPDTIVEVNTAVESSFSASPSEVKYRRIGDKVIQQDNATLSWASSNSDSASLSTLGSVDTSGTKVVMVTPTGAAEGPVNQDISYTFTATNVCGGTSTKTAMVHITGSVEGIPDVLLRSVYFPTDYPNSGNPTMGLVNSQQETLKTLADGFKKYLEYDQDAKLTVSAYADERGTENYNQALSELRAQSVKDFLVLQGVATEKIETSAYGKQMPLEKEAVDELQTKSPNPPDEKIMADPKTTWLAYNRRVDIVLLPTNAESSRLYPRDAADSMVIWQRPKPDATALGGAK